MTRIRTPRDKGDAWWFQLSATGECRRCHKQVAIWQLSPCSECGNNVCPSCRENYFVFAYPGSMRFVCKNCARKPSVQAKLKEERERWKKQSEIFSPSSLVKGIDEPSISPQIEVSYPLGQILPETRQPQRAVSEEYPIRLTLSQGTVAAIAMALLGFLLAVWMISTGKLGVGYDASAINRTIAEAQAALDSLSTERANLERAIAELRAVKDQLERTNQREQLKWAIISAVIGVVATLITEHGIWPFVSERVHKWAKGRLEIAPQQNGNSLQPGDAGSVAEESN